jgi:hypothetical protein
LRPSRIFRGQGDARSRKKVLVVFPTAWDLRGLRACAPRWQDRFEVELLPPFDYEWRWNFDVLGFLDEQVTARRDRIDGVFSSSDYPGAIVAGAMASRLGLSGTPPERIIRSSHKYYSRLAQREAVPEATPWFALVDPRIPRESAPGLSFPCFIKPVKGAFSVMSRRLDSRRELESFLMKPSARDFISQYVFVFNQLVRELTDFHLNGSYFLAEELLRGRQVTVEGFASPGGVEILGIVDSVRHPGTRSFVRFDYPSTLSRRVQTRMAEVARIAIEKLELRSTLFNVEMTYDVRRDRIFIVEVNPRMCGQFADLYEKVDGTNGYEIALQLAVGERPVLKRGAGAYRVASSFPLRIFEPSRVEKAPTEETIAEVERLFPGTLVWPECSQGDALVDFESLEDGQSFRYAVVNLGASDRESLRRVFREVMLKLDYSFAEVSDP